MMCEVYAYSDGKPIKVGRAGLRCRLEQNARELFLVEKDVVWPFEGELNTGRERADRIGNGKGRYE
jgi:hypothetical protein